MSLLVVLATILIPSLTATLSEGIEQGESCCAIDVRLQADVADIGAALPHLKTNKRQYRMSSNGCKTSDQVLRSGAERGKRYGQHKKSTAPLSAGSASVGNRQRRLEALDRVLKALRIYPGMDASGILVREILL
jgi:hypothetical protein